MQTYSPSSTPDFRLLFESAPGLYLVLTPALTIVAVSDAYLRATMTRREEILGRALFDVFPDNPDDPEANGVRNLRASLERVLHNRQPDTMAVQKYDIRRPQSEGGGFAERFWSPVNSPIMGPEGGIAYIIHRVEDVTDFVRLNQSELKHRSVIERAVFGIYQATLEGQFLTVNPALVSMLGYETTEELLGVGLPEVFADEAACTDLVRRVHEQQQFTGEEAEWRRKRGESIRVRLSGRVILVPGQELPVIETIVEDVTETYQLEEQLRQAQKMEAVGRLAGGIAHDFNNLLTAILGYSELLLDRVRAEPDLASDVEEIRRAGQRASSLTRQLLAFSRKQVLRPQLLDLNVVVAELGKMLQRVIGEDVRLHVVAAPTLGAVRADLGQIEQVLMNLAINARDAMPRGGSLTIRTEETKLPPDLARLESAVAAGTYAALSVADTGCGMSPEVRARIFEPFYTTKGPDKGTGLGLSTIYGIVTQSGGYITVDSERGRGTTFTVYLPVAEQVSEAAPEAAPPRDSYAGTETILLVDDEAALRSLARKVLERDGYRVLEASDGNTALKITDQFEGRIHLLLSDIIMPGLHGPDLAQWIVARRPDVRVLYISGYPQLATDSGRMGAHITFLQKPFNPQELAKAVRQCLDSGIGSGRAHETVDHSAAPELPRGERR